MLTLSSANVHLTTLKTFRQTVYASGLRNARDALFELGDAVLLASSVNSFAEFSLQPSFRRRWPMLYEALQDGVIYRTALLAKLSHPGPSDRNERRTWRWLGGRACSSVQVRNLGLDIYCGHIPRLERPLLAGDHTAWPHLHTRTLRERTVEHQPNAIPNAKPITVIRRGILCQASSPTVRHRLSATVGRALSPTVRHLFSPKLCHLTC